jgi:zinc transport system ATP-binding protein
MGAEQPLIEARGVSMRYGERVVLDAVDLALAAGEIVTLIGLNGAGKSTLVRVLLGLIKADAGVITRRSGLRIGYAPQHLTVDPTLPLTVERFLLLAGRNGRDAIETGLEEVGAAHLRGSQMATLSGGETHRVLLARALMGKPDLLVLDEPMSGVDVSGQAELYEMLRGVRDRRGCGVLLVSHDLHLVMAATDTVICLNHHVCCTGHAEAVVKDPAFAELFGARYSESLAVYHHHHDHAHDAEGHVVPIEGGADSSRGTPAP